MYNEEVYHGTDCESAENIIREGKINPSIGDRHWLGDGPYFFEDELDAFWWIAGKFVNNHDNGDITTIPKYYSIISTNLKIPKKRIFDLDDKEFFNEYVQVCYKIFKKTEDKNGNKFDGGMLNIMFQELGYDRLYDAVKRTFDKPILGSRMISKPQVQICIKKEKLNSNYKLQDYSERIGEHYSKLTTMFPYKFK
ncbi:hypothetical protein [Methanococcus maripaludis]|uniref:Uncharacterized protein n=1 Tax=Methanococcus maripaludis TaxID=39152 RepID=A0A8T4H0T6_METMI|nr:hypothetical protein [Methanococcus maripaludis]MBM7408792.1 hypothetical protein [Methanococcus maripaludis]MBP2219039.1 hypothetical protein [Methanococcus maripaludis]